MIASPEQVATEERSLPRMSDGEDNDDLKPKGDESTCLAYTGLPTCARTQFVFLPFFFFFPPPVTRSKGQEEIEKRSGGKEARRQAVEIEREVSMS